MLKSTAMALVLLAGFTRVVGPVAQLPAAGGAKPPRTLRLYVFDCGLINVNRAGTERYKVTPEEVGETRFAVPCFLVAHPKGTLMWDLGIVPDSTIEARAQGGRGNPAVSSAAVVTRTLKSQLSEIGYRPQDVTYFAFSHAHVDHNANANEFAASTWLARTAERVWMWQENNDRVQPSFFSELKNTKKIGRASCRERVCQ